MTGTILNAIGILVGGLLGLILRRPLSLPTQVAIKGALGVLIIYLGLKMTWDHLGGGSLGLLIKQLLIVVLALTLGRIVGRLLRLQKALNHLGKYAREKLTASTAPTNPKVGWGEGFTICSLLYCVGPLSFLGAVQDGLSANWQVLGAKAVIDGMATMAFALTFGWGVMASVVPVIAYQGTLSILAKLSYPIVKDPDLMMSIGAVNGLLVFCVALIILEVKNFEVADYLPSLAAAPLLTFLLR